MLQGLLVHNTFFASSSSSGILGLNLQAFVIQLLTFIIVLLALRQWAFKPIAKLLAERRETIDSGISLGEKMRAQEAELAEKVGRELRKARTEADSIITNAEQEARATIQSAEETARTRAENLVDDAKVQIDLETQRQRVKLEKDLVGLISDVSEAIIGEKVDAKKDAALIDRAFQGRRAA
jgi:F-type H+-transporting ATPase subunit b